MENQQNIKRIALLTSGGDSPGMNAGIRAVVRTAIFNNLKVTGVMNGFSGLLKGQYIEMEPHSVSKIISSGGTILKSSRCPEFIKAEARKQAYETMRRNQIDSLVVLGGDGSFRGAYELFKEFKFPVIGIPCTIDNDIFGTDFTIGFDTAVNTAVGAIDKLRDTADSHNMVFFVEVMGRHSGFIAINTAISAGAEEMLLPETKTKVEEICHYLVNLRRINKTSGIIVVAEGDEEGGAVEVARKVKEILPEYQTRITTLGHIQRGGSPTANDRVLASLLGYAAVNGLLEGKTGVMAGRIHNQIVFTPLEEAFSKRNKIDQSWIEISRVISM